MVSSNPSACRSLVGLSPRLLRAVPRKLGFHGADFPTLLATGPLMIASLAATCERAWCDQRIPPAGPQRELGN